MKIWSSVVPSIVLLGVTSFLWILGCENDVTVRLLPKPQGAADLPDAGEPDAGEPDAGEPKCLDGEPCSGLTWRLRFKGAYDHVEVPSSPQLDVPQDFALEAWVLVKSYSGGHGVINRWAGGIADLQLTFGVPEPLPQLELPTSEPVPSHVLASWGFVRADYWITLVAPSQPSVGQWHHLAVSYGAGSYRMYVDGVRVASADATEQIPSAPSPLYIGATARNERPYDGSMGTLWWPPIDGFIAEVRLSSGNRYDADFVPSRELEPDAATLALWHLNEGEGAQALDSGPGRLDGTIVGAEWALAPRLDGGL